MKVVYLVEGVLGEGRAEGCMLGLIKKEEHLRFVAVPFCMAVVMAGAGGVLPCWCAGGWKVGKPGRKMPLLLAKNGAGSSCRNTAPPAAGAATCARRNSCPRSAGTDGEVWVMVGAVVVEAVTVVAADTCNRIICMGRVSVCGETGPACPSFKRMKRSRLWETNKMVWFHHPLRGQQPGLKYNQMLSILSLTVLFHNNVNAI